MRSSLTKRITDIIPYSISDIQYLQKHCIIPLTSTYHDYDSLLNTIPNETNIVCIGEATHGTHEFYKERAMITRRLITERGFNAVA